MTKTMTKPLSKTAALRAARKAVSAPVGHGSRWVVYGPYRADDPSGPGTSCSANSFLLARERRTQWVAQIALILMGWDGSDSYEATYDAVGNIEDVMTRAIRLIQATPSAD